MREERRLGDSPVTVVPLGVGCWSWGDEEYWRYGQEYGPAEAVGAFSASLDAGLTLFDTAESYGWGKSEQIVGALARRSGRDLVLATKYAPLAGRGGPSAIERGLALSLKRLSKIGLYQIHWPDRDEAPIDAVMEVLAEAVTSGRVGAVGVSNFNAAEMRQAHAALERRGVPLATNQVRYSLLHRAPEVDGVLDACRELGVTLLAYSPLEQGLLCGAYDAKRPPLGKRAAVPWFGADNLLAAQPVLEVLREVAGTHGVATSSVALAWLMARPEVIPLAGARSAEQAAENAKALAVRLEPAELERLDQATQPWRVPS